MPFRLDPLFVQIGNAAKYIPRYVVSLTHESPDVIVLGKRQRQKLREPGIMTVQTDEDCRRVLGDFIADNSITNSLDPKDRYKIEEFVDVIDRGVDNDLQQIERVSALSNDIISLAINISANPIQSRDKRTIATQLIPGSSPTPLFAAA